MIVGRVSSLVCLSAICMCSCAEREATIYAELAEVCGHDDPVQLLAHDGPLARFRYLGQFGERRVVQFAARGVGTNSLHGPASKDLEFWSFGPCGESPIQLDVGPDDRISRLERWPELLLSCDESGAVRAIDPAGVHPPNLVFEVPGCNLPATPEGLVQIVRLDPLAAPELGALVLQAWPDDPWTESAQPSVLLEPVVLDSLQLADELAFVRSPDDEVLSVDWVGGQSQLVVQQARSFRASENGRYVMWQDLEITNADPERPAGPVFVLDRETGERHSIRDGELSQLQLWSFGDSGVGAVWLRSDPSQVNEYVLLPNFEAVTLPGYGLPPGYEPDQGCTIASLTRTIVDNDRVWYENTATGVVVLHDLAAASQRVLFEGGAAFRLGSGEDAINVLERSCDVDEGPLWRVPLAVDEDIELVAERANFSHGLAADGRVVTTVGLDQDWLGELIVVDPITLEEQRVDTRVFGYRAPPVNRDDPNTLVYFVDDGERSGVWLARLAP